MCGESENYEDKEAMKCREALHSEAKNAVSIPPKLKVMDSTQDDINERIKNENEVMKF